MVSKVLKHIFRLLETKEYSIEKQKSIIDSFSVPKNDYDRTYYNYKCMSFGRKKWTIVLFDICGLMAIPFLLFVYIINRIAFLSNKKNKQTDAIILEFKNRLGVSYSYTGRIPKKIYTEYKSVKELELDRFPKMMGGVFGAKAFSVWFSFFIRHPQSGFVNLRALVNLMGLNEIILLYNPRAIVVSRAELNGMSSLNTFFCEKSGIRYINFMHGESMAELCIAFVRFSDFYIWDKDYIDVYQWARCPINQFKVYRPEIFNGYNSIYDTSAIKYDYLYVFSGNDVTGKDENAIVVRNVLEGLTAKGKKCKVRPHPRWSDMNYIHKIFDGSQIDIENPRSINTHDSLLETNIIVGTYSTVLSEAYYMNKRVLIDDISDFELYTQLKEKKYIMLNKEHELLSQYIRQ